jgi:hypothetical protein
MYTNMIREDVIHYAIAMHPKVFKLGVPKLLNFNRPITRDVFPKNSNLSSQACHSSIISRIGSSIAGAPRPPSL